MFSSSTQAASVRLYVSLFVSVCVSVSVGVEPASHGATEPSSCSQSHDAESWQSGFVFGADDAAGFPGCRLGRPEPPAPSGCLSSAYAGHVDDVSASSGRRTQPAHASGFPGVNSTPTDGPFVSQGHVPAVSTAVTAVWTVRRHHSEFAAEADKPTCTG